jgi:(S)-mandelate dehydrogenase
MWPQSRRLYDGADPERAVGYQDLRAMALKRLPAFAAEFVEGGAEDELTLARNRSVFDTWCFAPEALGGVDQADLTAMTLGKPARLPIAIAPTGFAGLLWHRGDVALAAAAAAAGIPFAQSIASNIRLETVAQTPALRHWLQLYVFRDRDAVRALVERAGAAGCEALAVTVDSMVYGKREWDSRGYVGAAKLSLARKVEALRHPRWLTNVLRRGVPGFENLYDFLPDKAGFATSATWARQQVDPTLSWGDLEWLRSIWPGKLVAKGVSCPADVGRAIAAGVDAVVISNHGGRQLDGAPPPLMALPAIADAYRGKVELMIDSGFRRGSDVVKALALGADTVLVGRLALYGLAAAGEAGVSRALAILEDEMRRTMALVGVGRIGDLRPGHLQHWPAALRS